MFIHWLSLAIQYAPVYHMEQQAIVFYQANHLKRIYQQWKYSYQYQQQVTTSIHYYQTTLKYNMFQQLKYTTIEAKKEMNNKVILYQRTTMIMKQKWKCLSTVRVWIAGECLRLFLV